MAGAERLFAAALALSPAALSDEEHVSVRYNYGALCEQRGQEGDRARAHELYTAALALAPGDAHVLNRLALLERAHGNRTQAALALFERALASDPAHAHALANYALLLEDEGRHGEAYACLRRAARLAPDDADALCNLGHFEHTVRRRFRARPRSDTCIYSHAGMQCMHTHRCGGGSSARGRCTGERWCWTAGIPARCSTSAC